MNLVDDLVARLLAWHIFAPRSRRFYAETIALWAVAIIAVLVLAWAMGECWINEIETMQKVDSNQRLEVSNASK